MSIAPDATTAVTIEGDTLEAVAWRRYGPAYRDRMGELLALNRALVRHGPVLPAGTVVKLPPVAEQAAPTPAAPRLWD